MTVYPIAQLRYFMRRRVVSAVNWAGNRVQGTSRFRRFALRLLRGHPGLEQKLRSIYLGCRLGEQLKPLNWPGVPNSSAVTYCPDVSVKKEKVISQPAQHGINAHQRSPLEANFHNYQGRT